MPSTSASDLCMCSRDSIPSALYIRQDPSSESPANTLLSFLIFLYASYHLIYSRHVYMDVCTCVFIACHPKQNRNSSGHQFLAWLVTVPCPLSRCTPGRHDGCSVERPVRWVSIDMNESWHIFDFIGYKTTIPSRVTFILGRKIHPKVASGSVGYSRQMCFLLKG